MKVHDGTLLLDEKDSFDSEWRNGRLFCVLVPVSRKLEYQKSPLAATMVHVAENVIFYTEIK